MVEKIIEHEDRHAVLLPREIIDALGLTTGSLVEMEVSDGRIVVRPLNGQPALADKDERFLKQLYEKRTKVFKTLAE